jgi:hypothetical protein
MEIREFDSLINEKNVAGRIRSVFFMSNFSFSYIASYCNV